MEKKKILKMPKAKKEGSKLKIIMLIVIIVIVTILIAMYITDHQFRETVDVKILKKEVYEQNDLKIDINSDNNPSICAYDKYIGDISKNVLRLYNESGKEEANIEMMITNPIMESCGRFLIVAAQNGQNAYLVSGNSLVWQKDIDSGNISKINDKENGYVTLILTNTDHKSVIVTISPYDNGNELFRTYLSSTYALCADISPNNKYLAIGEVDYTGTIIKSNVKIVSIEKAQVEPQNAFVYTYQSDNKQVIVNIDYQEKNKAICLFNGYIQEITESSDRRLKDLDTENILFVDIGLEKEFIDIEKQLSGIFSYEYQMRITSTETLTETLYMVSDIPKSVKVYNKIITINFGTEIQIVNTSGWLIKRYKSSQEIKDVIINDSIVGIVYKDRIEIVNI